MSILPEALHSTGTWAGRGRRLLAASLRFLLPQNCILCGAAIPEAADDLPVCPACADSLPRLGAVRCPVCALPTLGGETCGACLRKTPAFDSTLAPFIYAFPLDRLVQALKYRHRLALTGWLGQELAEELAHHGAAADLLIPMPLHPRRLTERGFNQALELARPLSRLTGIPLDWKAVERNLDAPPQASLPWKARRKNIRGAFLCLGDMTGLNVLVVDDVMTTGATLEELARSLKARGAARVTNLVVARTLPHP